MDIKIVLFSRFRHANTRRNGQIKKIGDNSDPILIYWNIPLTLTLTLRKIKKRRKKYWAGGSINNHASFKQAILDPYT